MADQPANSTPGAILLVDDDDELRFILGAHLRAGGFEVLEASDGCQAVQLAAERLPNVIIMDVTLPGLDGVSATKALKSDERTATIPVIMLTARSNTSDVIRGLEAGAQEYLAKPFDITEFLARVRTVHRLAAARHEVDDLNTRLEAEVAVKTRRLQVLYEFMRDLNRARTQDQILDLVLRAAETITGARRISLFLRDESEEFLVCRRAQGIDTETVERIRVHKAEGITGQVFRSGKTFAARAQGSMDKLERDYAGDAFLSTPLVTTSLKTHEGIIGVLNVTNKDDNSTFGDDEIECIRSIADAAAIALDNIERRGRLQQSVRVLLQTVGHLAEYRDEETTQHLGRVSILARVIASELQRESEYAADVTDEFIENLVQAAPMHDIGKVGIPDDILTKPGKLTDEEFQIMKTHTDIGRRVLSRAVDPKSPNPLLQMCIEIAHSHHERWDGTGYPRRMVGKAIPLSARIITLVDAYDAMTSPRRYKAAMSHETAVATIRRDAGKHFDPVIAVAFFRCESEFESVRAQAEEASPAPLAMAGSK